MVALIAPNLWKVGAGGTAPHPLERVVAAVQEAVYIGTGGKVDMSATDHMGLDQSAFRMLEIKNGDWALVN